MFRKRPDGGYDLDELAGLSVSAIDLGGIVKLLFGADREFILDIERAFLITTADNPEGTVVEFRPYLARWEPRGMNELVSLFGATVATGEAKPDATLRLHFCDGRSLEVAPDPEYEGWGLWTPDGGWLGQPAGQGFV